MLLTLTETRDETPDVRSFLWQPSEPLNWIAGQYLQYELLHANPDDRGTKRYFTISSAPGEGHVRLTTRFANDKSSSFKRALFDFRPGDTITASEPDGDFLVDAARPAIMIAGGIGITPYRAMLKSLVADNKSLTGVLLYANRDENFVFDAELTDLIANLGNFRTAHFVEPARIDRLAIDSYLKEIKEAIIYLSGPEAMVEAFEKALAEMGVTETNIKSDYFPGYVWNDNI